jgi:hypothetical protein
MAQGFRKLRLLMSNYVSLKSVACAYFFDTNNVFPIDKRNRICFNECVHLKDVDLDWIKALSKEDKKKIKQDLKKFFKNYEIT